MEWIAQLARVLELRFYNSGSTADADESIRLYRIVHNAEPKNTMTVINLANIIRSRAERVGYSIDEITEAIQLLRTALDIQDQGTQTPRSSRNLLLNALGDALHVKFERTGSLEDLDEAIRCNSEAAADEADSNRAMYYLDLGNALLSKYEQLGSWEDLNDAIDSLELSLGIADSLNIKSNTNTINCLGKAFKTKYNRTQSLEDLDIAIQYYTSLIPGATTDRAKSSYLNNYANALALRSDAVGLIEDLHNAIQLYETAFNSTPVDHPDRPMYEIGLANSLHMRYQRIGSINDLNNAIVHYRNVVDLTLDGHPSFGTRASQFCVGIIASLCREEECK